MQHQDKDQEQDHPTHVGRQVELVELIQAEGPGGAAEEAAGADGHRFAVGPEHVGDDLALEHVGRIRVAVAAAARPQGQARGRHVVVDVEAFRVAHPGVVFAGWPPRLYHPESKSPRPCGKTA